jgi:hypothetical protein
MNPTPDPHQETTNQDPATPAKPAARPPLRAELEILRQRLARLDEYRRFLELLPAVHPRRCEPEPGASVVIPHGTFAGRVAEVEEIDWARGQADLSVRARGYRVSVTLSLDELKDLCVSGLRERDLDELRWPGRGGRHRLLRWLAAWRRPSAAPRGVRWSSERTGPRALPSSRARPGWTKMSPGPRAEPATGRCHSSFR